MNALELLEKEHDKVFQIFGEIRASNNKNERLQLFEKVKDELAAHTHIEQTVFYPAILENDDLKCILFEEVEEDKKLHVLLDELSTLQRPGEEFERKFKIMMKGVERHIMEESKMFVQIGEVLSEFELEEIGAELEAERQDFEKYN